MLFLLYIVWILRTVFFLSMKPELQHVLHCVCNVSNKAGSGLTYRTFLGRSAGVIYYVTVVLGTGHHRLRFSI